MTYHITTNNVPRPVIDALELVPAERAQFDYLDWNAIRDGSDGATFVRYRGELIDLGDMPLAPDAIRALGWDGFVSDTYFSGIVVRYCEDTDYVIVGRLYAD